MRKGSSVPTIHTSAAATGGSATIPVMFLTGPPGAGKSTAMKAFRRRFPGLVHFGVRVFFERQAELGTPLGLRALELAGSSRWWPDELVIEGLPGWLDENLPAATCLVFEGGYPRNRSHAADLDRILAERGLRVNRMVYMDVPDDVATARVLNRQVCVTCDTPVAEAIPVPGSACDKCGRQLVYRPDDNEQQFRKRLNQHRENAAQLLAHYEAQGVVVRIDGTAPPAEVAAALEAAAPDALLDEPAERLPA